MNADNFEQLVKARQDQCDKTLNAKGEEYSRGGERLHNFYSAAAMNQTTPEQALWGMMSKHTVSVADMVADTANGKCPTIDQVSEKLGDLINYVHLLEELFQDRREGQSSLLNTETSHAASTSSL